MHLWPSSHVHAQFYTFTRTCAHVYPPPPRVLILFHRASVSTEQKGILSRPARTDYRVLPYNFTLRKVFLLVKKYRVSNISEVFQFLTRQMKMNWLVVIFFTGVNARTWIVLIVKAFSNDKHLLMAFSLSSQYGLSLTTLKLLCSYDNCACKLLIRFSKGNILWKTFWSKKRVTRTHVSINIDIYASIQQVYNMCGGMLSVFWFASHPSNSRFAPREVQTESKWILFAIPRGACLPTLQHQMLASQCTKWHMMVGLPTFAFFFFLDFIETSKD